MSVAAALLLGTVFAEKPGPDGGAGEEGGVKFERFELAVASPAVSSGESPEVRVSGKLATGAAGAGEQSKSGEQIMKVSEPDEFAPLTWESQGRTSTDQEGRVETRIETLVPTGAGGDAGGTGSVYTLNDGADYGEAAGHSADTVVVERAPSAEVHPARGHNDDSDWKVETWNDGYFPTQDDKLYIGDYEYPRSRSSTFEGPDAVYQNYMGIYPYDEPAPEFYEGLPSAIDRTLSFFGPRDAAVWESNRLQHVSIAADASLGGLGLTRAFDPDRAHFKAGPFFMDVLYLGGGVLYSDYDGPQEFPRGEEPGWLSFIDFGVRGYLRITEQFYLAAVLNLVYLPEENEIGFSTGSGLGLTPLASLLFNYEIDAGPWDIRVYDYFTGVHRSYAIFDDFGEDAVQRAGRYRFGIFGAEIDRNGEPFFDEDNVYFSNVVGVNASRLFGGRDWRFHGYAQHLDFWRNLDFDDHGRRDEAGVLLGYNGSVIPFSPYAAYDVFSTDGLDSFVHRTRLGAGGRLTENLRISGYGGYGWTTNYEPDRESWLWQLALDHELSERTTHGVYVGQDFVTNDFIDETALAEYAGYYIGHRVSREVYARAFGQVSEEEPLGASDDFSRERESLGATVSYRPLDYTNVYALGLYERSEEFPREITRERWIYRIGVTQQLWSRYTGNLYYQYEEEAQNFNEHLYYLSIRRYF